MAATRCLLIVFLSLSSASTRADPCHEAALVEATRNGDFSRARLHAQQSPSTCSTSLAQLYVREADKFLENNNPNQLRMSNKNVRVDPHVDGADCWNFNAKVHKISTHSWWDVCCSQLSLARESNHNSKSHLFDAKHDTFSQQCHHSDGSRLCCDLFRGSSNYLHLPLLNELAVRLRVETDFIGESGGPTKVETYNLEQDGFLRKYDVSGILWPTGYLLGLCVARPRFCGVPEILQAIEVGTTISSGSPAVVELGAGIGVPSIVLAKSLDISVMATDKAPHALALTIANSQAANASVQTALLDHSNATDIVRFLDEHSSAGFAVVLGSSLQAMFDVTTDDREHQLWKTLDLLLDPSNPHAVALLAHSIKTLRSPRDGGFRLVRTISGNKFGMRTRYSEESDFEISVFQRRLHVNSTHDEEL